ncbi:SPFH domain-containing protein [Paenibacillus xylanexedens]|uniref:SPFH domain-containing protein n=1 Tax=Paenibacillus xylanexedens TaxID=528191 RepID=UPI000FAA1531|nr:prohibitin family protein [Paenibacillus xylanexedens]RPK19973.1 hypothetical protein EDO6_06490 [Paenibacillus xylanexedens]
MSKFSKGAVATGIVAVLVVGGFFAFTTKVNTGNAGLVINLNGGLEDKVLGQGLKPVAPWKKVVEYPISTETVYIDEEHGSAPFPTTTNEGKQVPVDARYSYHMDVKRLPDIYAKFKGVSNTVIENGWIKTELQKTVRSVTSQYTVFELNGAKISEINGKVLEQLTADLAKDGIVLEDFSIGAIHPDAKTQESIQANVDAQLALQKLEMEKKQKEIEAEKARIEAKGKADAATIEAQGTADANKLLEKSITPQLIQLKELDVQMEIAKNQNLPRILMGGNGDTGSAILNIPSEFTK